MELMTVYLYLSFDAFDAFQWQAIIKPQYLDHIPKSVNGKVGDFLNKKEDK
jgi:translation initiation factor RLI1